MGAVNFAVEELLPFAAGVGLVVATGGAERKPVENGGRSTVTVRDAGWYGKEVEDGDLWPWVWFGEEDEG
ncbi:hypothetical protein D5086_022162 [Populus alba]|uniref:Uncharacterized protein n=1 Tax=Populus alba TaxID=43335 RepID=A0ACC4BFP6_POPAL